MKTPITCIATSLGLGTVALAGELALIIDTSGSMAGSRIENAKDAAQAVVSNLDSGTDVSLRVFNGCTTSNVFTMQPMNSSNKSALNDVIENLTTGGSTPIGQSLQDVASDFLRKSTPRVALILTDGAETCNSSADLSGLAKINFNNGRLQTWIVGYDLSSTTQDTFKDVASAGKGGYLNASDNNLANRLNRVVNKSGVNDPGGSGNAIALKVVGPSKMKEGTTKKFKALLILNNGKTQDVTKKVAWEAMPVDFAVEKGKRVLVDDVRFWMTATYNDLFGGARVDVK